MYNVNPYLDMTSEMVISRKTVNQLKNKLTKLLHKIRKKERERGVDFTLYYVCTLAIGTFCT